MITPEKKKIIITLTILVLRKSRKSFNPYYYVQCVKNRLSFVRNNNDNYFKCIKLTLVMV